jgi:hypothetical protein
MTLFISLLLIHGLHLDPILYFIAAALYGLRFILRVVASGD